MQERIKVLAKRAGFYVSEYDPTNTDNEVIEKFAKLIIQECIVNLKDKIDTRYNGSQADCHIAYGMEIAYYNIIDNFGIEK